MQPNPPTTLSIDIKPNAAAPAPAPAPGLESMEQAKDSICAINLPQDANKSHIGHYYVSK